MRADGHNLFLAGLSAESRDLLLRQATEVALPTKTFLFRAEDTPRYAYFLTSGLLSVVSVMPDGAAVEVGMHGHESVAGAVQVLGPKTSPMQSFMQMDGAALRIPLTELRAAFRASEEIRDRLLELVQMESMILSQIAACNRLHDAEERLARWLLMAQDRVQTDVLELTQEFLAEMLGARRATVTLVASVLQRSGLIEYHRGRVKVMDRAQLEDAACDCYRIVRALGVSAWAGTA